MSRREARIALEQERKLKAQEKSARLVARLQSHEVRYPATHNPDKRIRAGENPDSIFGMLMTWDCSSPDCEGSWESGTERQWQQNTWETVIEPKLRAWSGLKWGEIDTHSSDSGHKMHHNMDTSIISEEAQLRLMDLERDRSVIFRFRLANKRRLWGFRTVARFDILWFDPNHEIYPTEPD